MDLVYLDNNATTKPATEVVAEMLPFLNEFYGNPSSVHRFGQRARRAIDEARSHVARLIHCADSEILFTAGGTESINTAIRGLLTAARSTHANRSSPRRLNIPPRANSASNLPATARRSSKFPSITPAISISRNSKLPPAKRPH